MTTSTSTQLESKNFFLLVASARAEGVRSAIKCMNDDNDLRNEGVQPFPWQATRLNLFHKFVDQIERETSVVAEMRAWEEGFDSTMQSAEDHSAKALKSNDSELKMLRDTITNMDALSQEGCGEISSIARLASASLEMAVSTGNFSDIVAAFSMICQKAGDIQNCVNVEAEKVGSNYVNESKRRRQSSLRVAQNEAAAVSAA